MQGNTGPQACRSTYLATINQMNMHIKTRGDVKDVSIDTLFCPLIVVMFTTSTVNVSPTSIDSTNPQETRVRRLQPST